MSLARVSMTVLLAALLGLSGCGVKGDPIRPAPQEEEPDGQSGG